MSFYKGQMHRQIGEGLKHVQRSIKIHNTYPEFATLNDEQKLLLQDGHNLLLKLYRQLHEERIHAEKAKSE